MYRLANKLQLHRYLNARLVLGLDVLLSVCASLFALFLASVFSHSGQMMTYTIVAWWLSGALVFSLVFFLLCRTHKLVIRHSTLRELGNIGGWRCSCYCHFVVRCLFDVHRIGAGKDGYGCGVRFGEE